MSMIHFAYFIHRDMNEIQNNNWIELKLPYKYILRNYDFENIS